MGLSTSASEKVRVAAEKEMPQEVGKKKGRCVSGVKGGGESDGAVVPESLPTPEVPQLHTRATFPYLWMPRFLLCRNLPVREEQA